MAFLERLGQFLSLGVESKPAQLPVPEKWQSMTEKIREVKLQTRAIDSYTSYPGLEAQLLAVQGLTDRPWRYPGINEALGTPAIFRAVSLIANTTGSLAVEAYRSGVRLSDEQTPRVIKRPDPFRIPRDFYRDSAFYMATRGECWWWVGARDTDNLAMSLIVVPPWEVTVEGTEDRLRPTIKWLDKEMRREDMRHITFLPNGYRGVGPLQLCGAAISVAVEAQEWAANFYSDGGYPSIVIKSATELGQTPGQDAASEAEALRNAWTARAANTPRVIDPGIESIEKFDVDESSTGALEGRNRNDGDAARMFGIPGALMEYATQGSSLTYQNVAEVYTQFVRTTLAPNYLEPIEQEMSDLLTRSTVARFNVRGFMRADPKTRAEVYNLLVPLGVMSAEQAAAEEGYVPGDVEFAPIPFSEPSAIPTRLPVNSRSERTEVRCNGRRMLRGVLRACNAKLATEAPYSGECWRCGKRHSDYGAVPVVAPVAVSQVRQPIQLRATPAALPEPVEPVAPPPDPYLEAMRAQTEAIQAQTAVHIAAMNRPQPQPQMTIAEGAVKVDVHTPPMTIEKGAVQVDVSSPTVTVEPSPVTIAEGAVRVDVAAPDMTAFRTQPEPTITRIVKDVDGNVSISRDVA